MSNLDVFISHSHKDKKIADAICHSFEHEKIKCWIAPRDIAPGDNWATTIVEAIPKCKVMLVVFSSHSNVSRQVLREVEIAVNSGLTILPVRIEDILPTGGMKYYLSTVHWIDAVDANTEESIANLLEIVQGMIAKNNAPIQPMRSNIDSLRHTKDANKLILPLSIAGIVVVSAVLLLVFRDSIFGGGASQEALSNEPTGQIIITAEPTAEPAEASTPEVMAEATAQPLPTVDPNISPDAVVDIPDANLQLGILKTLDEMGKTVDGAITVADMRNLTSLALLSEDYFQHFSELEFPTIEISGNISSLDGLQYASNLQKLVLVDLEIEDISALSQIYTLEYCLFQYNKISDLSPLKDNFSLHILDVDDNNISDISVLLNFYRLNELYIDNNPIDDFSVLESMYELQTLGITWLNLYTLKSLSNIENLQRIYAANNNINTFMDLRYLENLEFIDCGNCAFTDIYTIKFLENLQGVVLAGNDELESIEPLLEMDKLTWVMLDSNQMEKFADTVNELTAKGVEVVGN